MALYACRGQMEDRWHLPIPQAPVLPIPQASVWCCRTYCVNKCSVWQVRASSWLQAVNQMEDGISRNAKHSTPYK